VLPVVVPVEAGLCLAAERVLERVAVRIGEQNDARSFRGVSVFVDGSVHIDADVVVGCFGEEAFVRKLGRRAPNRRCIIGEGRAGSGESEKDYGKARSHRS
jgi:hypothetical protein